MSLEQFANEASAQLNMGGTLSSTATTITVTNQINCPGGGNFRIRIDNEYMKVTAVSGNNWTVVRGDGGTTATTHPDGSTVYVILTAEALNNIITIALGGSDQAQRRRINLIQGSNITLTITDNPTNGRVDIQFDAGGGATVSTAEASATQNYARFNDSTYDDINGLAITFTTIATKNIACFFTTQAAPVSANWVVAETRFSLDGTTFSNGIILHSENANPVNTPIYTFNNHAVFTSVAAGTHTIKAQWSNNGSSQSWNLTERRLTIMY